jgi:CRP-like cAMP-binding protein
VDDTTISRHRDNRLLAALPGPTLALLEREMRSISLTPGVKIYEPGEPIDDVYFPQTGLISLLVVTKDGGSIETSIIGREGAIGLHRALGPRRAFTRATVQVGGRFSIVRGARLAEIAEESSALREMIVRYTEVLWAEAQQIAACNATHDAAARLARWLLQVADRIGGDRVPLTQEFLAQMIGVRRTTVTLLAQAMQKEGLLRYSRGRIDLLNRQGLEGRACECYHIIRYQNLPQLLGVKL